MKTLRLLAAVAVICLAFLGLLSVFGVIETEALKTYSGQIVLGVVVVAGAAAALQTLGGRGGDSKEDPPPTL